MNQERKETLIKVLKYYANRDKISLDRFTWSSYDYIITKLEDEINKEILELSEYFKLYQIIKYKHHFKDNIIYKPP